MRFVFLLTSLFLTAGGRAHAADLVLASDGKTDYQVVLPDSYPTAAIGEDLAQAARLVQSAFQANGFNIPVVSEQERDPAKPSIYLGNTAFARGHGIDVTRLKGWSYILRVAGRDIILAGHDHPAPAPRKGRRPRAGWDRLGTAKAVTDFLREFAGTRFLYPDVPAWASLRATAETDFLKSPAFEFLPTPRITVPGDLDREQIPLMDFDITYPRKCGFYELAHNRFPLVDTVFGGHTWHRAIPPGEYGKTHPEYFALIGGKRAVGHSGRAQYCISNPDVRELLYQDLKRWLDRGYRNVDLGQPDGFRACQCDECRKLFNTGTDWSEKIWILNRTLAERLAREYPDRTLTIASYIQTAAPPKTFRKFPPNTRIMLTGTNEEDIAPWRAYTVPRGFCSYIYNWTPNLTNRYVPMRTPLYVEIQARRLVRNHIRSIYRDGNGGIVFGLEGPVYYTFARMFDDIENNRARNLVREFCEAAFLESAPAMLPFYEQLYHSIEPYAQFLATRSPAWGYTDMNGRRRKYLSDPFRMLGFLYPPHLLKNLEKQLVRAETLARNPKVITRLALVRREFDNLKHMITVVHLFNAFDAAPSLDARERLLEAIDRRNAFLDGI